MEIEEVVKYLLTENWAAWNDGQLVLTHAFYEKIPGPPPDIFEHIKSVPLPLKDEFRRFMEESKMPFQVTTPQGSQYIVKTTSPGAIKAYQRALKKVSYPDLLKVTGWYYAQKNLMQKTIQNYLQEELYLEILAEFKKKGLLPSQEGSGIRTISLNK